MADQPSKGPAAVVAAFGALTGPLHGGANEQAMPMLPGIAAEPSRDQADAAWRDAAARLGCGEKIMGFGHRVHKVEGPRATHLRARPAGLLTSVFSASRVAGRTAHVIEQHSGSGRVSRRGEYVGESGLTRVPVSRR